MSRASDNEALRRFAGAILREHRSDSSVMIGDVEAGVVQDAAVDAGLLEPYIVEGPCDHECECEPGDTCYRLSALGKRCVKEAE